MNNDIILLGHGSGGRLSHQLLDELIIPIVSGTAPAGQNDAAILENFPGRIAYTTDSFVVDPIFFPGGTIGSLAVHGTVNDLAMMGARPLWLSVGLIIEEGFSKADLTTILQDMRGAADAAGVAIVTGDTKVVPRGKADKIFITTSGVGSVEHTLPIHGANAQPGDVIIINGTIGDHGIAVMAGREGLEVSTEITSDSAAPALTDIFRLLGTLSTSTSTTNTRHLSDLASCRDGRVQGDRRRHTRSHPTATPDTDTDTGFNAWPSI